MSLLVRRPICHVHFILQNQRGCQIRVNLQRLVNVFGRLGLISECGMRPGQVGYGEVLPAHNKKAPCKALKAATCRTDGPRQIRRNDLLGTDTINLLSAFMKTAFV